MNRYYKWLLVIFSLFIISTLYQMSNKTATTMKYFPIDSANSIDNPKTVLEYNAKQKNTSWIVSSSSSHPAYLRQDVALLYANGVFKGLQNKWETNTSTLKQKESVPFTKDTLLEGISFHHGELHNDEITSIQAMTDAFLYIINEDNSSNAFQQPKTDREKETSQKLSQQTQDQLQTHLNTLLTHYKIDSDSYTMLPLVDIGKQNKNPLLSNTEEMNDKVLGQFWEGFYSEYITLLMSYNKEIPKHYMPFVLIAKDESHLLVLYELDKEKHKLIQQISRD